MELGIDSADTMMMAPFGNLGLYADDTVSQGCSWFWFTQSNGTQAISAHYFSPIPNYASSASTPAAGLAKPIRFIRFGYSTGPLYTVDLSVNGINWIRIWSSGSGWFYAFSAPTTLTRYGICLDSTANYYTVTGSRMSARICHLLQTAGPPPAPIL